MTRGSELDVPEQVQKIANSWATLGPPVRPCAEILTRYREALVELAPDPRSLLVLGSTPELRDLARSLGHTLTSCDIDASFWRAMALLCRSSEPETFIHGDWLSLEGDASFDLLIGDCFLNMLAWEAMAGMVARMGALLRPGGAAVFRLQAQNPELSLETLQSAFECHTGERTTRAFLIKHHFLVESLRSAAYPELSNREFYGQVAANYLTEAQLAALLPLTRDKRNFYPRLDALVELFESEFERVDHEPCPGSAAWGTTHLFVLSGVIRGRGR